MSTGSGWDELRSLLAQVPAELRFRAVVALLDTWPGDNQDALTVTSQVLESWPDEYRQAPWSWCCALAAGERKPTWSLVRAAQLRASHLGCESFALEQLPQVILGPVLTHLYLDRYTTLNDHDDAAFLAAHSGQWPSLRSIRGLDCQDDSLRSFLASDLLSRLEEIELFLPVSPTSANPVPGLTRCASKMQTLRIGFKHNKDIRPLLSADFLPALRDLYLYGESFTQAVPRHFRELATLAVLAQLRCLVLSEFPQEVVTGILARQDLSLQRLELRNRPYTPNLIAYQQNACRLTPEGVQVIAESAALPALSHLTVVNERVGDVILQLVEATSPGQLETLELINVGLTDQGVKRLAQMPQLRGVSVLNLQENDFTAAGLASLLRSPHLNRLRRLSLGGRPPWSPYYHENPTQPLGDAGAAAVVSSGLLAGLDELVLCSANIGPAGVAALAGAEAANLRRLDLSNNPLGSAGAATLAVAGFLPVLRELTLSVCQLDNQAMQHLSGIDCRSLRALCLAYNSIGPIGARHLADAPGLAGLLELNLHDNFIGDEGLIALAGSASLAGLIELDLEQDVWNYRRSAFGDEAARAVASSPVLSRLDSFFAGEVDEYTGGADQPPFSRQGRERIQASTQLRVEVRRTLLATTWHEQEGEAPIQDDPEQFFLHYTPRELERRRREHDFRGLPPPELSMDERQWREATDPMWMLEFLGDRADERKCQLFACACARRALRLQPNEQLEACIAQAEQAADGTVDLNRDKILKALRKAHPGDATDPVRTHITAAVFQALNASAQDAANYASQQAIRAAIEDMRRRRPGSVVRVSYTPEHAAQAVLLRCLFSNPHRRARLDPSLRLWNDGVVTKIARAIEESRTFDQMPILADALEEAGCSDIEILEHCRCGQEHVHGCWVLDLILNPLTAREENEAYP